MVHFLTCGFNGTSPQFLHAFVSMKAQLINHIQHFAIGLDPARIHASEASGRFFCMIVAMRMCGLKVGTLLPRLPRAVYFYSLLLPFNACTAQGSFLLASTL